MGVGGVDGRGFVTPQRLSTVVTQELAAVEVGCGGGGVCRGGRVVVVRW